MTRSSFSVLALALGLSGPGLARAQTPAPAEAATPAGPTPQPDPGSAQGADAARPAVDAEASPTVAPASDTEPGEPPALRSEVQALREEIEALKAERESASLADVEETESQLLRIYGFLDIGLKKSFSMKNALFAGLIENKTTFVLGNVNLYFDAQPLESWRALIEARLTNYPHGQDVVDTTGRFERTDTRVYDVVSSSGRNRVIWGGVVIERAQIEHTIVDLFNVRAGYFLTPYGIWNVDHGVPTLISLVLPAFQVEEAIPQRQLGVQAYGSSFMGSTELGYSAYVSNGRAAYLIDETDDKAVGARVTATFGAEPKLTLGASGYYGDSENIQKQLDFSDPAGLSIQKTTTFQYDEWAAGADVSLDWGGFRLRTEGLIRGVKYEDGKHEPVQFGAPGRFRPNRQEHYWYAILAYRYGAFEPYSYTELKYITPRDGASDFIYLPSLGLNIYFSPYTQLKAQYAAPKFYVLDGEDPSDRNFRLIDLRYVMSF